MDQFPAGGSRVPNTMNDLPPVAVRKLSVLVPLYNERWTLATIIRRVLAVPLDLELELIVVDDGSSDGSWEELQRVAAGDPRIRAFRHDRNRGKGAAIRTAIGQMTGDVAVVQDADLEYDPNDYLRLLVPIRDGRADAVFGSRFAGETHRVLYFWHSVGNKLLTMLSNMVNDVNLTDMETCYKMVRADVLRQLRLRSNTFTLEPEITCRLAQWGARIYEVPISYSGRTYLEGKKIKAVDGLKVLGELFRCRWLDPQFTHHRGLYVLKSIARARKFNRWLLAAVRPLAGRPDPGSRRRHRQPQRAVAGPLAAGAAGSATPCSSPACRPVRPARQRPRDPGRPDQARGCGALERRADRHRPVLRTSWSDSVPMRRCCGGSATRWSPAAIASSSCPRKCRSTTPWTAQQGHQRRYAAAELREKMERAGFEVVFSRSVGKLASLAWWLLGPGAAPPPGQPAANRLGRPALSPHPAAGLLPAGGRADVGYGGPAAGEIVISRPPRNNVALNLMQISPPCCGVPDAGWRCNWQRSFSSPEGRAWGTPTLSRQQELYRGQPDALGRRDGGHPHAGLSVAAARGGCCFLPTIVSCPGSIWPCCRRPCSSSIFRCGGSGFLPGLALAISSPLVYAALPRRTPVACLLSDFAAMMLAVMTVGCLLWVVAERRRILPWLALTLCLAAAYHVRPAYLFLVPLVPCLGVVFALVWSKGRALPPAWKACSPWGCWPPPRCRCWPIALCGRKSSASSAS